MVSIIDKDSAAPMVLIEHPLCNARLSLFGAQLLSFTPRDSHDLLWLSETSKLDGSKTIRGGVPICWPWFGPADTAGLPQHGRARQCLWRVVKSAFDDAGVTLRLSPSDDCYVDMPPGCELELKLHLGIRAELCLITRNKGEQAFHITQALHTYFAVADIDRTELTGLGQVEYFDKLSGESTQQQDDVVKISAACDRVYDSNAEQLWVQDGTRQISIQQSGHESVVVWNPWRDGAAAMADFDDEGYRNMLCVEAANTSPILIAPGEQYELVQSFGIG